MTIQAPELNPLEAIDRRGANFPKGATMVAILMFLVLFWAAVACVVLAVG